MKSQLLRVETFRCDAEFFAKAAIRVAATIEAKAEKFQKLAEIGVEVDASAFYPSIESSYGLGDLPFLRVANVNRTINYESATTIPLALLASHKTLKQVKPNDIVLTKGGSVARVGFVTRKAAVSRDLIFVNSSVLDVVDANFLYLYFLTTFANSLLIRSSSQSVQAHLTLTLVKEIPCFKATQVFKNELFRVVKASEATQSQSLKEYAHSEKILADTIGFSNLGASERSINVKSFKESFGSTGRLDAEHYQPKYDQLHKTLSAYSGGTTTVDSLAFEITNGAEVREYQESGTPYLRIGDLKLLDIDAASVVYIDPVGAEKGLEKIGLCVGDVLLSRSGSLAVSAVVESTWENALISSHLIRLRIRDTRIDPYFLALFFMTFPGKMQIQKWSNGGVQPEISQPAVKALIVPILPMPTQHEIRRLILEARRLRTVAEALLEAAKRAVEIAIEQDEAAGMAYLAIEGALA